MIANVPLSRIVANPWQTRQSAPDPEYIAGLADDIQANGLLQNPTGRLINYPDANFVVIAGDIGTALAADSDAMIQLAFGHNRLAAYRLIHERSSSPVELCMPVNVRKLTDEQMADAAWSENERRRDVGPLERARAIQQRLTDFNWTQEQAALHLGISRPAVANALRLLKLGDEIQTALDRSEITERQAVALLGLQERNEMMGIRRINDHYSVSVVLGEAKSGLSSDNIRDRADAMLRMYSQALDEANWKLDDELAYDGFRSLTCRDCEARNKHENRCLDHDCYQARGGAWRNAQLQPLANRTGIPALEDDRYGYGDTTAVKKEIRENSNCPNLRLKWEGVSKWVAENALILDSENTGAVVVCCKAPQFCKCSKGLAFAKDQADGPVEAATADELEDLAREARQAKRQAKQEAIALGDEAAARISTGLAMKNRKTWRRLAKAVSWSIEDKLPETADVPEIQDAIAAYIVRQALPEDPESTRSVTKILNGLLTTCGVELLPVAAVLTGKTLAEVWSEEPVSY